MILYKYIGERIITNTIPRNDHYLLFIYNNYTEKSILKAYNFILNNQFLKNYKRDIILKLYNKIKNVYNKLSYVARLYKWKKYKKYNNDTDLLMNPLSDYSENYKINIMQNETIYTFRLSDLLNIWNNALKKSTYLVSKPCFPKNPYNNLIIKPHNLINIFIKIKDTGFNVPCLIFYFWKCDFNINKFKFETAPILKDITIENYIEEGDVDTLYFEINRMLFTLRYQINNRMITLDDTIENKKYVVKTLKPYLKDYLISSETCNKCKQHFYYKKVIKRLNDFYKCNPVFGRRMVSVDRNLLSGNNIIEETDETAESDNSSSEYEEYMDYYPSL
jgi:hypothetical protein